MTLFLPVPPAIVSDRNAPQKHVWRAKIILATADGCGTSEIMRRSGKAKPVVALAGSFHGRRRRRAHARQDAQTRQAAAAGGYGAASGRFGALCAAREKPNHWTGRMLAKAAGVSLRSVQHILEAHQLAPHRIRTFKLSNDPKFALGRVPTFRLASPALK